MSWFTPEELPENKYYIFGKGGAVNLAKEIGIPLIGQIPIVQSIREGCDEGFPSALENSVHMLLIFSRFNGSKETKTSDSITSLSRVLIA